MRLSPRRFLRVRDLPACFFFFMPMLVIVGCASPGSPRPPSLQLPEVVTDLSVSRVGDAVVLRFTVPSRTTDGQILRGDYVQGSLCRLDTPGSPCKPVDTGETAAAISLHFHGAARVVEWTDALPTPLAAGPARLLAYRVELRNEAGHSGGPSDPAYAAAGTAPMSVSGLRVEGTRSGVLLAWRPESATGDVLLERQQLQPVPVVAAQSTAQSRPDAAPASKKGRRKKQAVPLRRQRPDVAEQPGVVWLGVQAGAGTVPDRSLDKGVEDGVLYRYTAMRRSRVKVGERTLELRSAPSAPVQIAWRDVYPPATPEGFTALGYTSGPAYAVDLIWQPVQDPRVTGYLLTRQALDSEDAVIGVPVSLTPTPVATPSFHDATAEAGKRYRYEVKAADGRGNVSAAAVTVVP